MIQQFYFWVYIQKNTKTVIWKDIGTPMFMLGFPDGSVVKNPPTNAGDTREMGSILGQEDPLE